MPRGYTVATAALAIETSKKWVDNVLSHFSVPGVAQSRQGVARRISFEAVFLLAITHRLSGSLGIPADLALKAAEELAATGIWSVEDGLALTLEREETLRQLQTRLEYAVEAAPLPRRGRPPVKAKRGA